MAPFSDEGHEQLGPGHTNAGIRGEGVPEGSRGRAAAANGAQGGVLRGKALVCQASSLAGATLVFPRFIN